MPRTAKLKKKEPSSLSRAARRAQSPPPRSNLSTKPSADAKDAQPWLYHAQQAGVTKRSKKPKALTRQQRLRRQKGLEHAARNEDRLEKKVEDSKRRGRKVQRRRVEWDELNGAGEGKMEESGDMGADAVEEDGVSVMENGKGKVGWAEQMVQVELADVVVGMEEFGLPGQESAATAPAEGIETDVQPAEIEDVDKIT